MSFYRITDPKKRDAMVADYIATVKRIKQRNLNERMGDLYRQREAEEHFQPVLQSNEKMMEEFVKDLKPIKEEVASISKYIKQEPEEEELPHKRRRIDFATEWRRKVASQDPDVDTAFGIRVLSDGTTAMGNKVVQIDGNDLIVADVKYKGTEGLWNLITGARKDQLTHYTKEEMRDYIDLLEATSALHRDFDPNSSHPRANGSWKWKNVLHNIWYALKASDDSGEDSEHDDDDEPSTGSGLLDPIKSCNMYVQRNGKCYRVKLVEGDGLFLRPHGRRVATGDGLFLKQGHNVYDGEGLLFGRNSPFKNIPILGWLL